MTTTHVIFWSGPSSSSIAAAGDAAAVYLLSKGMQLRKRKTTTVEYQSMIRLHKIC
jgi:NhaP-type Na+/H+ and K+/H+ antiporter